MCGWWCGICVAGWPGVGCGVVFVTVWVSVARAFLCAGRLGGAAAVHVLTVLVCSVPRALVFAGRHTHTSCMLVWFLFLLFFCGVSTLFCLAGFLGQGMCVAFWVESRRLVCGLLFLGERRGLVVHVLRAWVWRVWRLLVWRN